jgi:hypothetical protein
MSLAAVSAKRLRYRRAFTVLPHETELLPSARSGDRTNVSGRGLRKTGVFANSAGDFSAFGRLTRRFGHVETEAEWGAESCDPIGGVDYLI